ncbi:MAG: peptidylprolyl isomerase [Acidobacteriia bacterium]|nr:peptidylprolyl isomerase [Terriglobia bacterium]
MTIMAPRGTRTSGCLTRLGVRTLLTGFFAILGVVPAWTQATGGAPSSTASAVDEARAQLLGLADARRFDGGAFATLVANRDAGVRAAAARVLGELASPEAAALVGELAHDPDPGVRAAAAAGAGSLASMIPAGVHASDALGVEIHRLLLDPVPAVRSAAAWAAGAAQRPGFDLWVLQRLGREKDPEVEAAILRELWRFPGTLWIKRATTFVASPDVRTRLAAAWSLARSGRQEAVAGLKRASRDSEPLVRMVALEGARRGPAGALWRELLAGAGDADARVRVAALQGLEAALRREPGRSLPPAVVERLQLAAAGADPDRVQERVVAIRLAGVGRCAQGQLRAALAAREPWVAGEALIALTETGEPDIDRAVREWFASQELPPRLAAVRAFRHLNGGQQELVAALGDPQAAVRLAVLEALGDDGSRAATAAISQRLADQDPVVRAAAVQALADRKALPPAEDLLRLLARERGAATADAAVATVEALGAQKALPDGARTVLEGLAGSAYATIARAAWQALTAHGVVRPLPGVKTGEDASFYRKVVEWARTPRWIEVVTVRGTLQVTLDTSDAPLTCFRISELAEKKFFDGLTFHRVEPNFVVQGGDPRGDGSGGPGFALRDELSSAPFQAGSVGMALSGPDTGGSQIFVTLTPRPHLLGRYPLVGTVTGGFEVAQRLRAGDRILRTHVGEGPLPQYYPVWYGSLDPARLDRDIVGWRGERESYKPESKWLDLLRTAKLRYQLVVVMGTWCGDSREQIPRLQAVLSALGERSPFEAPRLLGVDRSKSADAKAFPYGPVELVPTIVVTAGGSEVGRVVETPKSGSVEEDLVRILSSVEGWQLPDE